jgi:prepilin-type N-terminal cleavage/methylation domain-containing protein/prepilin-type processing-associated H-X9-DG protein
MLTQQNKLYIGRRGFTLIELLVVISIIAVLMAIMMPALARVRQMARATICKTRLKDIGNMTMLFVQDNGRLPTTYPHPDEVRNTNNPTVEQLYMSRWQVRLGVYYDRKTGTDYSSSNFAWSEGGPYDYAVFRCPEMDKTADPSKGWANVFYGLNYMSAGRHNGAHENWTSHYKVEKITNTKYPLFGCMAADDANVSQGDAASGMLNRYLFDRAGPHPNAKNFGYHANAYTNNAGAAANHNGDANFLFIDFHVDNVDVSTNGQGPWLDSYKTSNGYKPVWFSATRSLPTRID